MCRTLIRQSSRMPSFQRDDSASSSHADILKTAMRVLMRSHTVEDMMHDLAQVTGPMFAVFEPGVDTLRNIFTLLGLTLDEQRVSADEFRSLLHGTPGV